MSRAASLSLPSRTGATANNVNYLGAARSRRKFLLFFPEGFDDPRYLVTERSFKERAHLEWQAELNPITFRRLLAQEQHRHIADVAVRIESRTHLLYSFERMALRDAVKTPAGARRFATALYEFLYGRGSAEHKFDAWVEALAGLPRAQAKVLTWPLTTVFGYIARPERHLLFKPQVTRKAARGYGFDLRYQAAPNWASYRSLLTFAAVVQRDLDRKPGLKPQDMIDLQSFIWVLGADEYPD